MILAPAAGRKRDREPHATLLGELECVGKKILQHLLQALGVCNQTAGEIWIGVNIEREASIFGFVTEGTTDHLEQTGEEYFLGIDGYGSGFNLGEIENVANEV